MRKNTAFNKPAVISLFSGAGGMDLGFTFAGYNIIFANDVDKYACETYNKNFGDVAVRGNIEEIPADSVPDADVVIGGFPCQDFSVLGGANRGGILVKRGKLYKQFLRFVKSKNPKVFLAENVKGIISANRGAALKLILRDFTTLEDINIEKLDEPYLAGIQRTPILKNVRSDVLTLFKNDEYTDEDESYSVYYKLVDFAQYGVPQHRERVIIVGIRKDVHKDFKMPDPVTPEEQDYVTVEEVFEGKAIYSRRVEQIEFNNEVPNMHNKTIERLKNIPEGGNYADITKKELKVKGLMSNIYKRLDRKKPAYTVIANGGGGTWGYHYKEPRALTNRERARLQTFPDWFEFEGPIGRVRTQIGNAVPPLGIMPFAFALKEIVIENYSKDSDNYYKEYAEFINTLKHRKTSKTKPFYKIFNEKPEFIKHYKIFKSKLPL